ncbi:MAG TPA: nucleotide exchange factor GrpE [Flavobacteriales bacterium]|nr:nucleotide exchange factor GrpE [Flavobacteriales bacterium]
MSEKKDKNEHIKEKLSENGIPMDNSEANDDAGAGQAKEPSSAEDAADKPEVELSEEEKLKNENTDLNNRFLRLYSEFDNFKRRTAKERVELYKTAGEEIILALLPVLDDLNRAIISNEDNSNLESVKEGFKLVEGKLKTALEKKGLENMNSLHTKFDTDMHEAITNIPAPKRKLKGKVVDVIEKGYLLNGKVIRYAKVVVGN